MHTLRADDLVRLREADWLLDPVASHRNRDWRLHLTDLDLAGAVRPIGGLRAASRLCILDQDHRPLEVLRLGYASRILTLPRVQQRQGSEGITTALGRHVHGRQRVADVCDPRTIVGTLASPAGQAILRWCALDGYRRRVQSKLLLRLVDEPVRIDVGLHLRSQLGRPSVVQDEWRPVVRGCSEVDFAALLLLGFHL